MSCRLHAPRITWSSKSPAVSKLSTRPGFKHVNIVLLSGWHVYFLPDYMKVSLFILITDSCYGSRLFSIKRFFMYQSTCKNWQQAYLSQGFIYIFLYLSLFMILFNIWNLSSFSCLADVLETQHNCCGQYLCDCLYHLVTYIDFFFKSKCCFNILLRCEVDIL